MGTESPLSYSQQLGICYCPRPHKSHPIPYNPNLYHHLICAWVNECYSLQVFQPKFSTHFLSLQCASRALRFHSPWFGDLSNIWRRICKLWHFSLCGFLQPFIISPSRSKYSPQHPVLRHSYFCPSFNLRDQFHTHIKYMWNYSSVKSIIATLLDTLTGWYRTKRPMQQRIYGSVALPI
jgi:hypothetical protein